MPSYQKAHIAVREVGGREVVSAEEGAEIENIPGSSFSTWVVCFSLFEDPPVF